MFASALLVVAPFLALTVNAGACTRKYQIQQGDICDGISAAKNVSTYQLATINRGVIDDACANLIPGNTICLGYEKEDCSTTYVVQADNSCEGIAASHGLNQTILYANNPQINEACDNIYIGEVLCVAKEVQVPPAPADGHTPATTIPTTAVAANTHKPAPTKDAAGAVPPPPATTPAPAPAPVEGKPAPAPAQGGDKPAPAPAHGDDKPAPAPAQGDDEDDEDLPYCDEL